MSKKSSEVPQLFFQLNVRGGEKVAHDLWREFRALGIGCENLAFWTRTDTHAEMTDDFELLVERRGSRLDLATAMGRLVRRLRAGRADAVLMHTTAAGLLVAPVAAALGVRRRAVIHHNPLGTYQGRVWTAVDALWGVLGFYTDVIFISDVGRRSADELPRRYRKRISLIENGIDPLPSGDADRFRDRFDLGAGPLIFCVGGLTDQKNHRFLLDAVADASSDPTVVIAGEGDLKDELVRRADELGVRLRLLGHVTPADVADGIEACDIFAFPSLHEGRALTLLEACHSAAPVVASDIQENHDITGDAALLLPLETGTWARAIDDLLGDRVEQRALRARVGAVEIPSAAEMTGGYVDLLDLG